MPKQFANIAITLLVLASTVGLAVPSYPAAAAVVTPGSLVQVPSFKAVYYIGFDGGRYVFPNQQIYQSWYADFDAVQQISAADLQRFPPRGNVTMRPGTRLVKLNSGLEVYAVEPGGILRWVPSESAAIALYGRNWAKRVIDLSDAFLPSYRFGAPLASDQHPDGTLFRYALGNDYYYLQGGKKRLVNSDAVAQNNLNLAYAITIPTTFSYPDGAAIASTEDQVSTVVDVLLGEQAIYLYPSNEPTPNRVAAGSVATPALRFQVRTGQTETTITQLTFEYSGTGLRELQSVSLYQGEQRLTAPLPVGDSRVITFSNLSIRLPAAQTATLTLAATLHPLASLGGTHSFSLVSSNDVTTSDNTKVRGSFPILGTAMEVFPCPTSGRLTLQALNPLSTIKAGGQQQTIANLSVQAKGDTILVRRATFTLAGDLNPSKLSNFTLRQGSIELGKAAAATGNQVTINLTRGASYLDGLTAIWSLDADVASDAAGSIQAYLAAVEDIRMNGLTCAYGARADNASFSNAKNDGSDASWTAVQGSVQQPVYTGGGSVTNNVGGGNGNGGAPTPATLTLALASDSPSGFRLVSDGTSNLELMKLTFTAQNEPVQISSLRFTVPTVSLDEIASLTLLDGLSVLDGPTAPDASGNVDFTLATTKQVNVGSSATLTVQAALNSTASGADLLDDAALTFKYSTGFSAFVSGGTGTSFTSVGSADLSGLGFRLVKAYPTFETVPLASSVITNGAEQDIYSFQVTANGGNVSWKQLIGSLALSAGSSGDVVQLANWKLLRDGQDITANMDIGKLTLIHDAVISSSDVYNGEDLEAGSADATVTRFGLSLLNQKEEIVTSGSSATYVIRATPQGFTTASGGQTVSLSLLGDSTTQYLQYTSPNDDTRFVNDGDKTSGRRTMILSRADGSKSGNQPFNAIWSDFSDTNPHDFVDLSVPDYKGTSRYPSPSSNDWFNGYGVTTLPTTAATLTNP